MVAEAVGPRLQHGEGLGIGLVLAGIDSPGREGAQALPGWRYAAERKTARVPERKPLERSTARGALEVVALQTSIRTAVVIGSAITIETAGDSPVTNAAAIGSPLCLALTLPSTIDLETDP